MKRFIIVGLLAMPLALSAAPQTIRIQGRLTDNSGNPIITSETPGKIQVAFYATATGGASLWQTPTEIDVETNNAGLFANDIGPIDSTIFKNNPTLYLELRVRDTGGLKTLSPRQKMATVPFAAHAESAITAVSADVAASVPANSIGSEHIKRESITTFHLTTGSVTNLILSSGAVDTVHLVDGAVTDDKIVEMSSTKIKGLIVSTQIASVAAAQITGALTTNQIGDAQVTDVKIATMSASKLRGPLELGVVNSTSSLQFAGIELLKMLQIETATSDVGFNTTSASFVDSPLAITVTPKRKNSKFLVIVYGVAGSGTSGAYYTIARNGTNLSDHYGLTALLGGNPGESIFMMVYDFPNTLAPVTYKAQIRCDFGTGTSFPTTGFLPNSGAKASIFAIEVAP